MKRIERKMKRIATRWKAREAMSANQKKKEIRALKETCLAEAPLKIWFEIGGTKQNEMIVDYKKGTEIKQRWKSGYRIEREYIWIALEVLTSKITYKIIHEKRTNKIYTPNPAHTTISNINEYLTSEEYDYWCRLNYKLVSINKIESNV